jgi:hypothetical protein
MVRETERLAEILRKKKRTQAARRAGEILQLNVMNEGVHRRVKDVIASAAAIAERAAPGTGIGLPADDVLIERGVLIPKRVRKWLPSTLPTHTRHAAWILKPCIINSPYGPQDPTIYASEELEGVALLVDGRIAIFEPTRHIETTFDELVEGAESVGSQAEWMRDFGSRCSTLERLLSEFDANRLG